MSDSIDYFLTTISPFTWLGHRAFHAIAARHGKRIAYRPINLAVVWKMSGGVPLAQRSEMRQRYRLIELQRIAAQRGLKLRLKPRHFPVDASFADRCIIAIAARGEDPGEFAFRAGEAVWALDLDLADRQVLARLLDDCGHDAEEVLEQAATEPVGAIREENSQAAIAVDALGAPAYVYRGETFWGQDRLDLLDSMLETGREPFRVI